MEITIFTFGVLLFLLGLVGKVEVRAIKVGTNNQLARVIAGIIGIGFVIIALSISDVWGKLDKKEDVTHWMGNWETAWGNSLNFTEENHMRLSFIESPNGVKGNYRYLNIRGEIEAAGNNDRLTGRWEELGGDNLSGTLEFLMFSDKKTFIGKYTIDGEDEKIRVWKGEKLGE